jgi:hypothetical protein
MLRVETSFQDTPGDGYYFVLRYNGRPLKEQLQELGLKDGDTILLWDPESDSDAVEATLLLAFRHPVAPRIDLWAREKSKAE